MKSLCIVALAAFVVLSTAVAVADSIPTGDPVIRSGGGTGSVPITSPHFTILTVSGNSPTDGTPCILVKGGNSTPAPSCFFRNDLKTEDSTIHELRFVANQSFSGALTCALNTALGGTSPWFTQCTAGTHTVLFFGGAGIPFGGDFSFGFRGFNNNATFSVKAVTDDDYSAKAATNNDYSPTTVPEPRTLAAWVALVLCLFARGRTPLESRWFRSLA